MATKESNLARIAAQQAARDLARGKAPISIVDIVTEEKSSAEEFEKPKKSNSGKKKFGKKRSK